MKNVANEFINELKKNAKSIKTDSFKKQIPNILTFSRAIAPLIIIPTLLLDKTDLAIIELLLFASTDFFDGKLARKYNCVTDFGIKLDAVCDKFFALALLIPAMIKYPIISTNILIELFISYINIVSESKDNKPKSNMIGKVKTFFLSAVIISTLAVIPGFNFKSLLLTSIMT